MKLKMAIIGCAAILASAFTAPVASADIVSYDDYPASAVGAVSPALGISMTVENTSLTCSGGAAFGVFAQRPSDALTPNEMTNPSECNRTLGFSKVKTQINMNGCKLRFHPEPAEKIDIYPPNCGPIEIVEGTYCTRYIDPQSGISNLSIYGITTEKIGGHDGLSVEAYFAVPYRIKSSGTFCHTGSLTWNSTWKVTATANGGEAIGVRLAPPTGMFLTGEASESEAKQPRFDFESSPSYVSGSQDAADPHTLNFTNRIFQCDYANWEAGSTAATKSLSLTSSYEYCDAVVLGNTLPAIIKMNSCSYKLHAQNAGPPYSGSLDISCTKAGDGIEAKVYSTDANLKADTPLCAYKIAAQNGLGAVGLSNIGSGSNRQVVADLGLTGVAFTRTTGSLATCGFASGSATYSGTSNLHGLQ